MHDAPPPSDPAIGCGSWRPVGWLERVALALHGLVALIVAFSFGFSYKVYNQQSYLIGGFRRLDPGYLPRDWLFEETTLYHTHFEWVIWALGKMFGTGTALGWSLVAMQLVVVALTVGAFSPLCYVLAGRRWSRALLPQIGVAFWIVAQLHWGPAFSYVTGYGMQPSTISAMGICAAIAAFALGRKGWAGVALALGGMFHANFLVLGLLIFGLAQLLEMARHRALLVVEALKLLVPGSVVLVTILPMLLNVSSQSERGLTIFHTIRAPWHYQFSFYIDSIWAYFAWAAIGALSFWMMRRHARHLDLERAESWTRLTILWAMFQLCVLSYCALVWQQVSPKVTQLFVWRMAPYASMIGATALCFACEPIGRGLEDLQARFEARRGRAPRLARAEGADPWAAAVALLLIVAALAWMATKIGVPVRAGFDVEVGLGLWCVALFVLLLIHAGGARLHAYLFVVASIVTMTTLAQVTFEYYSNSPSFEVEDTGRRELYAWIRQNTATNALFMIPPLMSDFRVYAGRSVIADWKTSPVIPEETVAWYERMEDLAGRKNPRRDGDVVRGYRALNAARLDALLEKYAFDYAVVHAKSVPRLRGRGKVVYKNADWAVLVPEPKAAP